MGAKPAEQPASPGGGARTSGDLPRVATFTRGDLANAGGDSNNGSFGASSMEGTFAGEVRPGACGVRRLSRLAPRGAARGRLGSLAAA